MPDGRHGGVILADDFGEFRLGDVLFGEGTQHGGHERVRGAVRVDGHGRSVAAVCRGFRGAPGGVDLAEVAAEGRGDEYGVVVPESLLAVNDLRRGGEV